MTPPNDASARVALVAGATGLVGQALVAQLLVEPAYAQVHTVGRRSAPMGPASPTHLFQHVIDFQAVGPSNPLPLGTVDDVYIALGTTIKVAGSQGAFAAVDLHAVVNVARAALAQGAQRVAVVSALGADANSRVFYSRTKGQMEQAVAALGYRRVVFARPSLLGGQRQEHRPGEGLGIALTQALGPLVPKKYRVVPAPAVARALVATLLSNGPDGLAVLESDALQRYR